MGGLVVAVIVTYKRKELLRLVIERLLLQSYTLHKILVIDNNSDDGTREVVAEFMASNNVEYFNTGANTGGAGGFKHGFQQALRHDFTHLWLMDDDVLPEIDCLENLLMTKEECIVQPMRYNKDGGCAEISPIIYDLANPFLARAKRKTVQDIYTSDKDSCLDTFAIHSVPFEGPLISRSVVEAVGLPNEKFFIFNDDLDYSIRARMAGYPIFCNPRAKAVRLFENNQNNDLSSWKGYYMLRNHFYILRTYGLNPFVKLKPYWLALLFSAYFILKRKWCNVSVCYNALLDSKSLKNSEKHRP